MQWSLPLYGGDLGFKSWRLFILVGALPAAFAGLALIWFPESPKFLLAIGRREEALRVLKDVYTINTGKTDFPVSQHPCSKSHSQKKQTLSPLSLF